MNYKHIISGMMNKTKAFMLLLLVAVFGSLSAQNEFVGTIYYDVEVDAGEANAQMAAMMPKETIVYLGRDKICSKQTTPFTTQSVIVDSKSEEVWILMSMMQQKFAIHNDFKSIKDENPDMENLKVVHTGEKKIVAGYQCEKVTASFGEGTEKTEVVAYVTDEIKGFPNMYIDNEIYSRLGGFILEIETETGGVEIEMKAREVKKEIEDPSVFEVPDDYTRMTMDEFLKMMGE